MRERLFRMKKFEVRHRLSAMKVGVDAVLLGAWCRVPASGRVLDAGCGCGIISLMVAQRSAPEVRIEAVDIDVFAIIEAKENFNNSLWHNRLHAYRRNFCEVQGELSAIVSNPPYFVAGRNAGESARMMARHAAALSPLTVLTYGCSLLTPGGTISMISPPEWLTPIKRALPLDASITRLCTVSDSPSAPSKRMLLEVTRTPALPTLHTRLYIHDNSGAQFSADYVALTRDFYLNF